MNIINIRSNNETAEHIKIKQIKHNYINNRWASFGFLIQEHSQPALYKHYKIELI